MSLLDSITRLIDPASETVPVAPESLGVAASPSFISSDPVVMPAGGFSAVYAFGDSLSDAGNIATVTARFIPSSPYSGGRFTDGAMWVQDLSQALGLPAVKASLLGGTDYAYGGATTGTTSVHQSNPSDLPSQVATFSLQAPSPSPNALYTVWIGSNDVLDIANSQETATQQQAAVQQAVGNEVSSINALIAHGAKDLVVLDVPDLGQTPYERARPATQAASSSLAQAYNADLGTALQQIMAADHVSIDYIDTYSLLDAAIASPSTYGLTNVTQPLWNGNLDNPHSGTLAATGSAASGYLFFDSLHPTATGHSLIAQYVAHTLTGMA